LKKRTKKLLSISQGDGPNGETLMLPARVKSFLVLFFKKEHSYLLLSLAITGQAQAQSTSHLSTADVRAALAAGGKLDLSGKDLSGDDLSGLDLSGASLAGATLHQVKLVGTKLRDTNLAGADLAFTWVMQADFSHADLRGANMQTMITSSGMANSAAEAADFTGANLSNAHLTVHFSWDHMAGANFTHADMSAHMNNQSMGLLRTEFDETDLAAADFTGAAAAHLTFQFAKLRRARFIDADVRYTNFDGAYLDGADFTGAKTEGATFDGASLAGVKGLARR
jgi:uncharacterized protein YjbI with pentapeptide repeats